MIIKLTQNKQTIVDARDFRYLSSGYKGVFNFKGRFQAHLMINGKRHYLGCYGTPEEAAEAYNAAARKHQGAFARLNIVGESRC